MVAGGDTASQNGTADKDVVAVMEILEELPRRLMIARQEIDMHGLVCFNVVSALKGNGNCSLFQLDQLRVGRWNSPSQQVSNEAGVSRSFLPFNWPIAERAFVSVRIVSGTLARRSMMLGRLDNRLRP